jgi:hypothetical protein
VVICDQMSLDELEADAASAQRLQKLYCVDHAVTRMRRLSRDLQTLVGRSEEELVGPVTPLRLRREIERLAEVVPEMHTEGEVREAVGGINRRIVEWRKTSLSPPIYVRLVNKDEMVSRWPPAPRGQRPRRFRKSASRLGAMAGGD